MTLFGYTIEIPGKLPGLSKEARSTGVRETLKDLHPGEEAHIQGFAADLPAERLAHLQAYGLVPGRLVRLLQHSPVTIIQVEHCEVALEDDLARQIKI